jgi:hypothetical protein
MVNFPDSLDDDESLFIAVNNLRTFLDADMTDAETEATVTTTSGFPPTGYISILSGDDILETEAITYSGTTSTQFLNLDRGAGNTTAYPHATGDNVDLTIVADHHNTLKDAVIELEHMLGASGSENFVPFVDGNVVQGNVALAGTLSAEDDFDFKEDGAISGSVTIGPLPPYPEPAIAFVVDEDQIYVDNTGGGWVDILESPPLAVGVNLLFWRATAGEVSSTPSVHMNCVFASVNVGEVEDGTIASNGGAWGGTDFCGWQLVTGNGVNTAKLEVKVSGGDAVISAASIMAIPLQDMGLVENTDYWQSATEGDVIDAAGGDGTVIVSGTHTLPEDGDYLYFGTSECAHTSGVSSQQTVYYYTTPGSAQTSIMSHWRNSGWTTLPTVKLLTLNQGDNDFVVEGRAISPGEATWRKTRQCIFKASSFNQIASRSNSANDFTTSPVFNKIGVTELSYTPSSLETIVVFGNPLAKQNTGVFPATAAAAYKLVNETDGIDYNIDASPGRIYYISLELPASYLFTVLDNVSTTKTFSLSFRDPQDSGETIKHEAVNMVVWSMSTAASTAIQYTSIDADRVRTPLVQADDITILNDGSMTAYGGIFSDALTISGVPVATGTASVPDPLTLDTINATTSLTISGVPVVDDIPDPLDLDTINAAVSLTVSGVPVSTAAGGGTALTVKEADGSPTVADVDTIVVTNGTLTDDGGGQVTLQTGGAGGTVSGTASRCIVTRADATQSINSGEVTTVEWDTVVFDNDGWMVDLVTSGTVLTVPEGVSLVKADAQVHWDVEGTQTDDRRRGILIRRNFVNVYDEDVVVFSTQPPQGDTGGSDSEVRQQVTSPPFPVTPGDELMVQLLHGDGVPVDIKASKSNWFSVVQMDPPVELVELDLTAASGTFTESLTISGVPVSTGTGIGSSNIDSINAITSGDIIIDGSGGIAVDTLSQTITIDGSGVAGGGGSGGELTTSGLWFNPHALPENVHPKSDFFDDNSTNPTLSGFHWIDWNRWTMWDVSTVSGSLLGRTLTTYDGEFGSGEQRDSNMMLMSTDSSSPGDWVGVYQTAPAGSFTITTRVSVHSHWFQHTGFRAGVFMADDLSGAASTSDFFSCHLHQPDLDTDEAYSQYQGSLWTDYQTQGTTFSTTAGPFPGNQAWLRVAYNDDTGRMEAVISEDGIGWRELYGTAAPGFTPSHIGFGIQDLGGAPPTVAFEFFAVSSVFSRGRATGHGRLLPVVISGGTGGGGAGTITDINISATGPSVTITGVGNIQTITEGNVITITGTAPTDGFRGAVLTTSSGLDYPNASFIPVLWDTEVYDTDGFHNPANDNQFIIPAGINKIRMSTNLRWAADATGERSAIIIERFSGGGTQNLAAVREQANSVSVHMQHTATAVMDVQEGQTFEVLGQVGGATSPPVELTSLISYFALEVVDPVAATSPAAGAVAEVDFLHANLSEDQTSNFDAGDHIEFDGTYSNIGDITLSSGTGQISGIITLPAGKTYSMIAAVAIVGTAPGGTLFYRWKDRTHDVFIGDFTRAITNSFIVNAGYDNTALGSITTTEETEVEVYITSSNLLDEISFGYTSCQVMEVPNITSLIPDDLYAVSGTFTQSLTISGVPVSTGTGTIDHAALDNLDFASAGHTGFGSSADVATNTADIAALTASGVATDVNVATNVSDIAALTTSGVATDANIVSVSGHLQGEIDATQPDVDSLNTLTGDVTVTGVGRVDVTLDGQSVVVSGSQARLLATTTLDAPSDDENFTIMKVVEDVTLTEMHSVIQGPGSPSVDWTVRHDWDRSAISGTEVVISGTQTTSTTSGDIITVMDNSTITGSSWVWLETTVTGGSPQELTVELYAGT